MKFATGLIAGAAMLANAALGSGAIAQEKAFSLELNNANDNESGCRLTYIALNGTGIALDKTAYEVVVFDADQRVAQFLILEFGKLPAGKTKVVQFDLPRPCNGISRILINDVSECTADGQPSSACLDSLKTTTRTDIGFGL